MNSVQVLIKTFINKKETLIITFEKAFGSFLLTFAVQKKVGKTIL